MGDALSAQAGAKAPSGARTGLFGRLARWTEPTRVDRVMRATGCSQAEAVEYLLAEEGDDTEAIAWYRADRRADLSAARGAAGPLEGATCPGKMDP